jgi:polysaccharide deacetylase 2 family uncharacterized protein YibQ
MTSQDIMVGNEAEAIEKAEEILVSQIPALEGLSNLLGKSHTSREQLLVTIDETLTTLNTIVDSIDVLEDHIKGI